MPPHDTAEHQRLRESEARRADWKRWGPYVSDRAWGTVREDYSADGEAWDYFPHDHARSRAYRWNEDGIGGFCNRLQNICLGVALWNERDPILKERFFGLAGNQGNHGEDLKEYYFYLDGVPSHAYMKMLYKYPQVAFPYAELERENRQRGREVGEFELLDALGGAFGENRYFDVFIEYAKAEQDEILCRITAVNRSSEPAPLHLLPQLWFRNTWSWGYDRAKPDMARDGDHVVTRHPRLGTQHWYVDSANGNIPNLLFTENDTNTERVFGEPGGSYVKDAFHDAVIHGKTDAVNPNETGTKVAAHIHAVVPPGGTFTARVLLGGRAHQDPFAGFDGTFRRRIEEADAFYEAIQPEKLPTEERSVQRQAFAGLLWSKQFYHYGVELWLSGDPSSPPPAESRKTGRNAHWPHVYNLDVISMPDKWEYPWFAAWDLAFHTVPLALIDPEWAKRQLILMLREWYMHPNGQIPAYEWDFGDTNPPVHAWAAWRVYKITRDVNGKADTDFLEKVFHKLLLNFTWWVNRKDTDGRNIFEGGFLGLDNIGVFDRSRELPTGGHLEQADGTAWMAMYCLNMLAIALELAQTRPAYEDVATKFFEHFIYIAHAINKNCAEKGLWNERSGFYNDILHMPDGRFVPLEIRSFVGLIPLFAVETLEPKLLDKLPRFKRRMEWFVRYRPDLLRDVASLTEPGREGRLLLSLVDSGRLMRILERLLDPEQFLAPHGLRSLSLEHRDRPYSFSVKSDTYTVGYEPAESRSSMFGGNSNWRGPIWFPLNFLMIESLQKYHHYYGADLKAELPRGSGVHADLDKVSGELSRRLISLFLPGPEGKRPAHGSHPTLESDPLWKDHVLFFEYFHGDNGTGLGASHQTGWTALVAKLIQQQGGGIR